MNKMIEKLMQHDIDYELGKPCLDDIAYDKLKEDARQKYPNDPYFKKVGAKVTGSKLRAVKLPYILGSLDKLNVGNVMDWAKGKGYITWSEKVDAVSISCKWENRKPTFLVLRGDGEIGQDITSKAKFFIPDINTDETIELRGEATFINNDYEKIIGVSGQPYKNRRNGTAGLLNREDDNSDDLSLLYPFFYEIISAPYIPKEEYERFLYIKSLGLQTPDFGLITTQELPFMINTLIEVINQSKKYKPYDVDGVVLTKNISVRENVLFPKDKVAFKIKNDEIVVTVENVTWAVSRFGRLKPVINITPVKVGGVTITNPTGFNASFIKDNEIGKGTKLKLIRAGDVIPHITGIVSSTKAKMPKICPSCGLALKMDGEDLRCDSIFCNDSGVKRATYFLKTIGVKGYSDKTIEKMGIVDIFGLTDLNLINRNIRWSAYNRYVTAVKAAVRNIEPHKIIAAFGIQGIGLKVAKEICDQLGIINNDRFHEKLFYGRATIDIDVGEKTTETFISTIKKYRGFFEQMEGTFGLQISKTPSTILNGGVRKLEGLKFVVTGTLPIPRNEVISIIEAHGGSVSGTVTPRTTKLIANITDRYTTKYKKAESLNTPIIGWSDFRRFYGI